MVFSSIPPYLDPSNWQQHPNQHGANRTESPHQLVPPLPQQPHAPHVGGGAGSITRPGSIADRAQAQAQLVKIPPPEAALKCPRCESTNTKFCYFNNYNLSQPRHFCKTCRRYWTRGGALRNVPVGGGCRRNKKNKRTRSKSPVSKDKDSSLSNSTSHAQIGQFPQSIANRPYMTSLQNLSRYGVGNLGLNLREIQAQTGHMGFQIGGHGTSAAGEGGVDQWCFQQFPFLNGFESTSAVSYPFQSETVEAPSGLVGDVAATSRVTQLPPVKLEYNGGLNLSRSPLSISDNNHYNSWTDLSALASSSASHLL